MKLISINIGLILAASLTVTSCTNLDETVYSQVMSSNYYKSREDIVRAVLSPFEHAYWTCTLKFEGMEESGDQIITPTRDVGSWYDNGRWIRAHTHTWNIDEGPVRIGDPWSSYYVGIGKCNLVMNDLDQQDASKLNISAEEKESFKLQLRALRAWFHYYLFDGYRNIIIDTKSGSENPEDMKQVSPQQAFDWLETELKDLVEKLPAKTGNDGNGNSQGTFTKAAAATMLVRLYLNAEKYIGQEHWQDCIEMCKRITNREFGNYQLGKTWYEVFDWNNETSNEVIFAFPSTFGGTHWAFDTSSRTIYWRCLPVLSHVQLGITDNGGPNPQWVLSPSFDNDGSLFNYKLGMVTQKFAKYPGDVRYKQYKNTGVNQREGMFFLEGYIRDLNGVIQKINGYNLYLLDRVGSYDETAAQKTIAAGKPTESTLINGDWNSGLSAVKYPMYPTGNSGRLESDYVEMRLPEVIYSEAECLLRQGHVEEAAVLLNSVRKRNYPQAYWQQVLYAPEGNAKLDMDEMLDEWGREFLTEARRRIDLIRFGRFEDAWWDKPAEKDTHTELWPLLRKELNSNLNLRQNPGYEDITR